MTGTALRTGLAGSAVVAVVLAAGSGLGPIPEVDRPAAVSDTVTDLAESRTDDRASRSVLGIPTTALEAVAAAPDDPFADLGSLLTQAPLPEHEFSLTRAIYSGGGFRRRGAWATDFPKADRQFLYILQRMLRRMDVNPQENAVLLTDPVLRRYPFLYALEVGSMYLSDEEIRALRDYVHAGGFLMIDDFWGSRQWANFEYQMRLVFPDRTIEPVPMDHPIFHSFYDIEEILQVPSINNAYRGRYWEQDGYEPYVLGIFDDFGDLMVVINWNTDLGDAWEWSESPDYPFDRSSYAYQMAINTIMYAMTH